MQGNDMVNAAPVKSFFVQMLTRDIELSDAILDLLDNCIDGILRTKLTSSGNIYDGYRIDIKMSPKQFSIEDNCGGIPVDILKTYAFRMGRVPTMPKDAVATVGTFGIGMKRAIFKMGERCEVVTRSRHDSENGIEKACRVVISPEWIKEEQEWDIPFEYIPKEKYSKFGTRISISDLNASTRQKLDCEKSGFDEEIRRQISITYGFMISKGLFVFVNGVMVESAPLVLKCGDDVSPYVYKGKFGEVDVFLAVGLTAPLQEGDGTPEDGGPGKYSAQCAGWTILCNDRVVLYADKTILTGWGDAGVPQFHPQYNSICGIVAFNSDNVRALPTTTTKRGVDAANPTYLAVKNFMREGTKVCVKFTNDWKRRESEVRDRISTIKAVPFQSMKERSDGVVLPKFNSAGKGYPGQVARAQMPVPPRQVATTVGCSITVERSRLYRVAGYLGLSETAVRPVIQGAFDHVYEEAMES